MNGSWRSWLLGICALLVVSLITNDLLFQRQTREQLAKQEQQIKSLESRDTNIIKYFLDNLNRLERHIDQLESK